MDKTKAVIASYIGVLLYSALVFVGAWKIAYWQGLLAIPFIDLAKFWPLCRRKGSIEGCRRYPESRKVHEIALRNLRVKQALYQLSYDPECGTYSLHQPFFAIVRKLPNRFHSLLLQSQKRILRNRSPHLIPVSS